MDFKIRNGCVEYFVNFMERILNIFTRQPDSPDGGDNESQNGESRLGLVIYLRNKNGIDKKALDRIHIQFASFSPVLEQLVPPEGYLLVFSPLAPEMRAKLVAEATDMIQNGITSYGIGEGELIFLTNNHGKVFSVLGKAIRLAMLAAIQH